MNMKITVGKLKRLLTEASQGQTFKFDVHLGDETFTCTATYNPMTPREVEVWQAVDSNGQEVDVAELEAQGVELQDAAFSAMENQNLHNDMDPPGTGWDDQY